MKLIELFRLYISRSPFLSGLCSLTLFPSPVPSEKIEFEYPTTEEAWRRDWENIGNSFRRAFQIVASENGVSIPSGMGSAL